MQYKIIGAPEKFNKWTRPLFRPKTNHTCHQKPNPFRETVPLRRDIMEVLMLKYIVILGEKDSLTCGYDELLDMAPAVLFDPSFSLFLSN